MIDPNQTLVQYADANGLTDEEVIAYAMESLGISEENAVMMVNIDRGLGGDIETIDRDNE